ADHTAPQRVIEIEYEHLARLSIDRTDNRVQRPRHGEVRFRRKQYFVRKKSIPIKPVIKSEPCRDAADVLNEKLGPTIRFFNKRLVETHQKARSPSCRGCVHIAKWSVRGQFKIVLDYLATDAAFQRIPDRAKSQKLRIDLRRQVCFSSACSEGGNVVVRSVKVNDVRAKVDERLRIMDRIYVIAAIFRLVKSGRKAIRQQKKLEQVNQCNGCRAAQHRKANWLQIRPRDKLSAQTAPLHHQIIKR